MVIRAKYHKFAQNLISHFNIPLHCIYFNNKESEWPHFFKIALKGTVLVPKFTIMNLLVWILLLLETLVSRVALGIHLESHHQIDLIEELHLLNTTYNGLSVEGNFYHFNPTIFLFEDNRRSIRYSPNVNRKASYLISQSKVFTFIASVKQNKQNTGTIISFTEGINRFLELQSVGRKNEIRLHYRHDNIVHTETFPFNIADEKWHKIALSVSAIKVDLYIDCNHIYTREIREIDTDLSQHSNVTLWLGQRYVKHCLFRGYMRDVKIISKPNGYITQCPHLDTENCPTCGHFKSLQNSVIKLENFVIQLTERLYETERRLLSLEECDCYKSCNVNGSLHPEGSSWKQNCDICSCVRGEVTCRPIHCPIPCKYPELNPNECCPVCKKTCYLNGQVIQHGERIKISTKNTNSGRCGECVCNDGHTSCKQIDIDSKCPELKCPLEEQFSREGECCKFCAGADFCSAGNDCHMNATCHNLKAEYVCHCNKGFKGDGKVCQDINECDHEGGNDGHHCGQNTICENSSGSYKCECLDGFTRLDKYKCIDIDECTTSELNECNENAICINTLGSYECETM